MFSTNIEKMIEEFLEHVQKQTGGNNNIKEIAINIKKELFSALSLPVIAIKKRKQISVKETTSISQVLDYLHKSPYGNWVDSKENIKCWGTLFSWIFVHKIGDIRASAGNLALSGNELAAVRIEKWQLNNIIVETLQQLGIDSSTSWNLTSCLLALTTQNSWFNPNINTDRLAYELVNSWFKNINTQNYLQVNLYNNILWFNKETFDEFLWWAFITEGLILLGKRNLEYSNLNQTQFFEIFADPAPLLKIFSVIKKIADAEKKSNYQVERLLSLLQSKEKHNQS